MKLSIEAFGAGDWYEVLSVTTTSISDNEICNFLVNMKESVSARRLTRLPSKPKNGVKFSGTEVSLSVAKTEDVLVGEIKRFLQKMLILKIPNVAIELVVERGNTPGSRYEYCFLANECNPLPFLSSQPELLKSGLEDYVLKHGNVSSKQCHSCCLSFENLKVGSGTACCMDNHRNTGLVMEGAIIISEISEQITTCFRLCGAKTELY